MPYALSKLARPLAAAMMLSATSACAPIILAGATATVISAHDRRSTGAQADDETAEWKASNRVPDAVRARAHVNFTAFNRALLVSGEALDEEARQAIAQAAASVEGIRRVHNEMVIAPLASSASRAGDALTSTRVRAQFVAASELSANHIKTFCENGTLFLLGIVSDREAKLAIQLARTTPGVRKVVSLFEILPEAQIRQMDNAILGAPRSEGSARK